MTTLSHVTSELQTLNKTTLQIAGWSDLIFKSVSDIRKTFTNLEKDRKTERYEQMERDRESTTEIIKKGFTESETATRVGKNKHEWPTWMKFGTGAGIFGMLGGSGFLKSIFKFAGISLVAGGLGLVLYNWLTNGKLNLGDLFGSGNKDNSNDTINNIVKISKDVNETLKENPEMAGTGAAAIAATALRSNLGGKVVAVDAIVNAAAEVPNIVEKVNDSKSDTETSLVAAGSITKIGAKTGGDVADGLKSIGLFATKKFMDPSELDKNGNFKPGTWLKTAEDVDFSQIFESFGENLTLGLIKASRGDFNFQYASKNLDENRNMTKRMRKKLEENPELKSKMEKEMDEFSGPSLTSWLDNWKHKPGQKRESYQNKVRKIREKNRPLFEPTLTEYDFVDFRNTSDNLKDATNGVTNKLSNYIDVLQDLELARQNKMLGGIALDASTSTNNVNNVNNTTMKASNIDRNGTTNVWNASDFWTGGR